MINLLTETKDKLELYNKCGKNVLWVGCKDKYVSWESFVKIASSIEYTDRDYYIKINEHLLIAGDSWWLERCQREDESESVFEGYEWWEYKELPKKPNCRASLKTFNLLNK